MLQDLIAAWNEFLREFKRRRSIRRSSHARQASLPF